ncbi:hypothetical protein DICVIV_03202 [Dictyocaulus viviparus]|uniref:Uncharacterized protein n=1 Tax=Dictyocaulus viviparus TaxID=29172 RepID=A0A0D8Y1P8_DICVI|nr:hypothetical protein DICVIV_03202 [Dictyocaulus viviparus]
MLHLSRLGMLLLVCIVSVTVNSQLQQSDDEQMNEERLAKASPIWMNAKRARNPYSWMAAEEVNSARNPYYWMGQTKGKRLIRYADQIYSHPRNPYSWMYTMFDKRTNTPYSWMNE